MIIIRLNTKDFHSIKELHHHLSRDSKENISVQIAVRIMISAEHKVHFVVSIEV